MLSHISHSRSIALLAAAFVLTPIPLTSQVEWQPLTFATSEPTESANSSAFAWDDSTGDMVWLGSPFSTPSDTLETWRFDGSQWTFDSSTTLVPFRAPVGWDPVRHRFVALGNGTTVEWSAGTWQSISSTNFPNFGDGTLAYDEGRGEMLLFGGSGSSNTYTNELWAWDGTDWTLRASGASGPSPRSWAAMAYDPSRDAMVMNGGWQTYDDPFACDFCPPTIAVHLSDTWTWDGTSWTQLPQASWGVKAHAMAWDSARDRMVVFGGSSSTAFGNATAELIDDTWVNQPMTTPPGTRNEPRMAFDGTRQRLHVLGGYHNRDQAILETADPATQISIGTSCSTADLDGVTRPWLNADWQLRVDNLPIAAATQAILAFGLSAPSTPIDLTVVGMPGCSLYVDIAFDTNLPLTSPGQAEIAIPIGSDPVVAGLTIWSQAFIAAPGANPLGLVATSALSSTIGIR